MRTGSADVPAKIIDPGGRTWRVRYAIANILRGRVVNEGAFRNYFEMQDVDEVICTILRRGLKNPKLRSAVEGSHLIDLNKWLSQYPDFAEPYFRAASSAQEPNIVVSTGPKGCHSGRRRFAAHLSTASGGKSDDGSAILKYLATVGANVRRRTPQRPGPRQYRYAKQTHAVNRYHQNGPRRSLGPGRVGADTQNYGEDKAYVLGQMHGLIINR